MTMMMEDGQGQDWRSLARTLEPDQILEVLSGGFCSNCQLLLESRIHTLLNKKVGEKVSFSSDDDNNSSAQLKSMDAQTPSPCQCVDEPIVPSSENTTESFDKMLDQQECTPIQTPYHTTPVHSSIQIECTSNSSPPMLFAGAKSGDSSEDPNEHNRVLQVRRQNFVHIEYRHGRRINVLQGLELHTRVFDAEEQKQIIECVYNLQRMGKSGQLRARTYSEPRKWMRGKGRVTIQFGCCYNYAVDKNGNRPGIVRDEDVDPLPPLFKQMIKRMVGWHILPSSCIPDSCIVNIYDEGDCIPPHIDHDDFVRPFCTVSLLAECKILFGSNLKVVGPGDFSGPYSIRLPVGSVLLLDGNAANVAKHCIPGVPARRISITFRKMDSSKLPHNFFHDPELQGIKPYAVSPFAKSKTQQDQREKHYSYLPRRNRGEFKNAKKRNRNSFLLEKYEFSPPGRFSSGNRRMFNRR
ncbi:hypothetical protein ACFX13_020439 [Malus domestica]|uniref:Fe2OG dioxygenase domain-containing protein n=1 Tax=Malus domestica TaxID=3750 RepID=A0A498HPX4_MALDO|nr:RNA demethylase ALKBH9B-like [Malus domestica]XP_050129212.1 RNA demethylase ALKBH9B-like [Malus sylvestris]RXH73588.1 hypothetical protein DVH24_016410 [Malus domestica]